MADHASRPPSTTPPPGAEILILVADDDADMRLYIRSCLRPREDIRIVEACDGDQALELATALLPRLIVSDLVMPGLDGVALCRTLKADARTREIPFLLVSGEARSSCADRFLAKPFNAAGLRAEVDRLMRLPGHA